MNKPAYRTRTVLALCSALTALAVPASAASPAVTEARFGNGMRVLFLENHALPTVYLGLMFKGAGSGADPQGKSGLAALTAALLREGTVGRSADQIAQTVDSVGAVLSARADYDTAVISISAMSRDTPAMVSLLADVAQKPAFAPAEFKRAQSHTLGVIQRSLDDADGLATRALAHFLMGDHPYGLPPVGLADTVGKLTPADVSAFHSRWYRADNAVLVVAGDIRPAAVAPVLDRAFGTFAPAPTPPPLPAPQPAARRARILLLDKPDLDQAKLAFGHLGIPREHPDYYAGLVMNGVLGGTGFLSRLTTSVRSAKGLTYGIRSVLDAKKVGGSFYVFSFSRTDKAVETLKAAQLEIANLQANGVKPAELRDVKNYLAGAFALSIETPEAQAGVLLASDLFNLGLDHLRAYPQKVREVTAEDVARAATGLINQDAFRYVVVGNAAALKDGLSTLGDVEIRPHTAWAAP